MSSEGALEAALQNVTIPSDNVDPSFVRKPRHWNIRLILDFMIFIFVLFIIRTAGNPFRSRSSSALAATTILVVIAGILIPFTPFAAPLGFAPLPGFYFD